jgi:Zn-dependent protease
MSDDTVIQQIAVYVIPMIFAITLHEAAHAFMSHKYGDDTAKLLGRLSLNPAHHIDIVGTIIFPLIGILMGGFIFGWAKPVPINFNRLQNPKRNLFWIAFAGPAANFIMALIWALILKLSTVLDLYFGTPLNLMAQAGIAVNISLMILNLIPILPLDGGRMLFSLLPEKYALVYTKIERYGMWILILLLLFGGLNYIIKPLYLAIVNYILLLIG